MFWKCRRLWVTNGNRSSRDPSIADLDRLPLPGHDPRPLSKGRAIWVEHNVPDHMFAQTLKLCSPSPRSKGPAGPSAHELVGYSIGPTP